MQCFSVFSFHLHTFQPLYSLLAFKRVYHRCQKGTAVFQGAVNTGNIRTWLKLTLLVIHGLYVLGLVNKYAIDFH